jgi:hypothetical protein
MHRREQIAPKFSPMLRAHGQSSENTWHSLIDRRAWGLSRPTGFSFGSTNNGLVDSWTALCWDFGWWCAVVRWGTGGGPFGLERERDVIWGADRRGLLESAEWIEFVVTSFAHRVLLSECVIKGSSIGMIVLHAYCLIDSLILQISFSFGARIQGESVTRFIGWRTSCFVFDDWDWVRMICS